MIPHHRNLTRGFTIVELLLAAAVVGSISAIISINFSENSARARDASRSESIHIYSTAMEKWNDVYGSYFVYNSQAGSLPLCSGFVTNSGYLKCSGSAAVGYYGGSGGGITSKNRQGYTNHSIADSLYIAGFLPSVRFDPLDTSSANRQSKHAIFSDFILTLCNHNSSPANSPLNAKEYAIFTALERPLPTSEQAAQAHCSGKDTPSGGWDNLIAR
jgi:prepilin-type N-terminal cleavage/methylation domain-containing protein